MRRLVILFLSLYSSLFACAQVGEHRSTFSVGVNGGYVLSSVGFDPKVSQSYHGGAVAGLSWRYTCEKYFNTVCALQVELNYARLGWKEDIQNSAGEKLSDTYQRNMNYIQLPMFANLGWGREEKGFMFYSLAGPQVGYCFGDNSVKSSTWTLNPSGNPDRPNNMYAQYDLKIAHKLDYGITAGVGLELNTSKLGHFTLEGRYYYGLGDVFGNSKKDVFSRSANSSIVVKMGYYITVMKN